MKQRKGAGIFRDKKKRAALMTALASFLLGTIFLVSTYTYYTPVAREDTIAVNATFSSYREITGKNSRREIKVFFDDREPLVIESACMTNAEVYEKMRSLRRATGLRCASIRKGAISSRLYATEKNCYLLKRRSVS